MKKLVGILFSLYGRECNIVQTVLGERKYVTRKFK